MTFEKRCLTENKKRILKFADALFETWSGNKTDERFLNIIKFKSHGSFISNKNDKLSHKVRNGKFYKNG